MTVKQKRFIEEYLIDLNGTQAAIRAGYSKKTAHAIATENLSKPIIKAAIEEHLKKLDSQKTAELKEIMEYLTSVLRGKSTSEVVVVEGIGEGCSEAKIVKKHPDEKERLKAAELLGKRYGMFDNKIQVEGVIPVVIKEDL